MKIACIDARPLRANLALLMAVLAAATIGLSTPRTAIAVPITVFDLAMYATDSSGSPQTFFGAGTWSLRSPEYIGTATGSPNAPLASIFQQQLAAGANTFYLYGDGWTAERDYYGLSIALVSDSSGGGVLSTYLARNTGCSGNCQANSYAMLSGGQGTTSSGLFRDIGDTRVTLQAFSILGPSLSGVDRVNGTNSPHANGTLDYLASLTIYVGAAGVEAPGGEPGGGAGGGGAGVPAPGTLALLVLGICAIASRTSRRSRRRTLASSRLPFPENQAIAPKA